MMFRVRHANPGDFDKIYKLYKRVAVAPVGIARSVKEITESYVHNFMKHAAETGIELVIEDPHNSKLVVAEIHCYKQIPKTFRHVLSDLTIVVDPDFQGKGLGKAIFTSLLEFVMSDRHDILRVELVAQESNAKAIEFYKKIGFVQEGKFEKRIILEKNKFEADIPMAWFNPNYLSS